MGSRFRSIQEKSKVLHLNRVTHIAEQLAKGDNVILLANHQTELDPQAISLLLEKTHPRIAEEMIFVAGHRVVSDPLAILGKVDVLGGDTIQKRLESRRLCIETN